MTGSYHSCFVVFRDFYPLHISTELGSGKRCNQGQYQSFEGQKQCIACPNDTTTLGFSSKNLLDAGSGSPYCFLFFLVSFFTERYIGGTLENGWVLPQIHHIGRDDIISGGPLPRNFLKNALLLRTPLMIQAQDDTLISVSQIGSFLVFASTALVKIQVVNKCLLENSSSQSTFWYRPIIGQLPLRTVGAGITKSTLPLKDQGCLTACPAVSPLHTDGWFR